MTEVPHLLHVFPTFCAAGPQVRTAALMGGFKGAYRHTVVALDGRTEAADLVPESVSLELAQPPAVEGPLGGVRGIRRLIVAEKPDLLLTYNWGAMDAVLAARSVGQRRLVHHEDGFNADEAERLKARRNFTRRIALRRTDIVVPSRTLERIARRTWRLPRVNFIPNGVDTGRFARDPVAGAAFRAELGIDPEALIVGAVGHLRPVKNLTRLVRAAARIDGSAVGRPVHLVLIGEGPTRGEIESTAAQLRPPGGDVHLTGHLTDLVPAFSAFDVFSLSSDSEQQPVSLLEALSTGCPVAATDVGDVKSSLPEEAQAQVVPLGRECIPALGAALTRLLVDPPLRERLAAAGVQHAQQHYSLQAMLDGYQRVWQAALAR